jgi:putative transposase
MSSVSRVAQEAKMETPQYFKFDYSKQAHSVGDNFHHFEWCPKYRFNMFSKFKYKNLAEACIRKAAHEHGIEIQEISVMPDHVHLIAKLPLTMAPSKAYQLLKGRSAYIFFRAHPKARLRYPRGHLWSRGKFAASIGYSDIPSTTEYIQHQEEHHCSTLTGNPTL